VGELFIATIAKSGGELRTAQVKAAQKEREDALAVQLIALLKRYVYGDEEGFLVGTLLPCLRPQYSLVGPVDALTRQPVTFLQRGCTVRQTARFALPSLSLSAAIQ
jgi:hypothetical protein